ncbi:uncharacterized protein LOC124945926 [Impatiens glandulifera]|uniref:uncharacterized protein LOC124945926 n=1 Tax=Impatiens glandulifera TaxID=253017 RepID=UPI001FB11E08|nr:uncharacterized protein LOC124945926 [Impatiens glandulifera]XP_047342410.1 uncharacterized protein LOC124945926 [Impatiens glandulifera]
MLFAVEGGGFFSSSASGYSEGLTLLLLGHRNEEKRTTVSPWNQCQLADQKVDPDLELASRKKKLIAHGCASFVCFGCGSSTGTESQYPLKVGSTFTQDDLTLTTDFVYNKDTPKKLGLKSSLKRSLIDGVGTEREVLCKYIDDAPGYAGKRKVHWTDASGGELAEIREFELSDIGGSYDEYENGIERTCSCKIM